MLLDGKGEVVGASWHAYLPAGGKGKKNEGGRMEDGRGDFDILTTKPAPRVVFEKAAKGKVGGATVGAGAGKGMGGKEGEGEEVVEKSLLQK